MKSTSATFCSFHERAGRALGTSSPDSSFPSLLSSFQLLENAVVAAESLRARLPNQPALVNRMLEDASGCSGMQTLCILLLGVQDIQDDISSATHSAHI